MMRGLLRGACALGLLVLSTTAVAQTEYNDLGHRVLNSGQDRFRYYLDARSSRPAGIELSEVETATKAAFQAWEDVACAWPAFQFESRATTGSPMPDVTDPTDRYTVVPVWVTERQDPRYRDTLNGGDLAAAARPLTFGGYLYQCDIFLNAVDFRWSTLATTPSGTMDLRSVLLREVGHCLGLGSTYETDNSNAVMFAVLNPGQSRRQLAAYDREALCRFYPETGAVGSPCAGAGTCTAGLTCTTVPSTTTGNTLQVCAKGCTGTTSGECPAPYVCRDSNAVSGFTKACLPALPDSLTPVGRACGGSAGSCGSANGRCIPPTPLPSGSGSGFERWDDGYCTESCSGKGTCPGGAECAQVEGQGQVCLQRCGATPGDCRPGYTCARRPEGDLCVPACYGDVDCDSASVCRLCDRVCVARQVSGRQVGDACTEDTQCGTNQYCLRLNGNTQGVCAQPCALQACSCPGGTTCRVVSAEGERACVRDCSQGSCASPTTCNAVEDGAACLAACRSSQDCPPNTLCGGDGACYDPSARPDAGTCALCNDAGIPPPPPVDAGPGEGSVGGPGGCGCQGAPASAAFLGGLGVLLLMVGRRRSWHKQ
jgi:hypothetical protein